MQKLLAIARSRKTKIAFNAASAAIATVVCVLLVQHFRTEGWPLSGAKVYGVIVASVLFLLGYALKALGWRRLFAPHERPDVDGPRRRGRSRIGHGHRAPRSLRRARARRGRTSLSGLVRRCRRRLPLAPAPRADRQRRSRTARGALGRRHRHDRIVPRGTVRRRRRRDRSGCGRALAADDGAGRTGSPGSGSLAGSATTPPLRARLRRPGRRSACRGSFAAPRSSSCSTRSPWTLRFRSRWPSSAHPRQRQPSRSRPPAPQLRPARVRRCSWRAASALRRRLRSRSRRRGSRS